MLTSAATAAYDEPMKCSLRQVRIRTRAALETALNAGHIESYKCTERTLVEGIGYGKTKSHWLVYDVRVLGTSVRIAVQTLDRFRVRVNDVVLLLPTPCCAAPVEIDALVVRDDYCAWCGGPATDKLYSRCEIEDIVGLHADPLNAVIMAHAVADLVQTFSDAFGLKRTVVLP